MHVRSHTDLPGFIAEGNRITDALAMPVLSANLPDMFSQAKMSHSFFHQNAPALKRMFHISKEQARAIVTACPNCNKYQLPSMSTGVNPRGLHKCQLWQTNVTYIPSFGRLKYIHVSVDTFSGTIFASTHAGEKTKYVMKRFLLVFATQGVPEQIKIDN